MNAPTIFGDARNLIPLFVFIAIVLGAFIAVLIRGSREIGRAHV